MLHATSICMGKLGQSLQPSTPSTWIDDTWAIVFTEINRCYKMLMQRFARDCSSDFMAREIYYNNGLCSATKRSCYFDYFS